MLTIVYAVLGYIFLTVMVRVLTRRPGAQMTMPEFVLVFLMGGVIIAATSAGDRSVTNCTCAVITVACLHRLVSGLKIRYPKFGLVVDGTPLVVVARGEWKCDVLYGMRMSEEDVMAAARTTGIARFEEIDYAVIERNGGITVIKKQQQGEDEQQSNNNSEGEMH